MRIALYSPYIPKHSGGGERYLLSIAEALSGEHTVSLLVPNSKIQETEEKLRSYQETFGLDLSKIEVDSTQIGIGSTVAVFAETSHYDVLFAMTDGSFFPSIAKRSYLIIQVPWTRPLSIAERVKLQTWKQIVVYSDFVAKVLSASWKTNKVMVLSPYVDVDVFKPGKKENRIISTGRFFAHSQSNSKRQDVLLAAFQKFSETHAKEKWKLSLVGNIDPNPDSFTFVEQLRAQAKGYDVDIATDISFDELCDLYAKSKIYWHAAGYGVNEQTHPENTEHFGITTLEAMASGAIPVVVPKGGQVEIVGDERLFWNEVDELIAKTTDLCALPKKEFEALSLEVCKKAQSYRKELFSNSLQSLLKA